MSLPVAVTHFPVNRATSTSALKQAMFAAVDVSRVDILDLECTVNSICGGIQPPFLAHLASSILGPEGISSQPSPGLKFREHVRWTNYGGGK